MKLLKEAEEIVIKKNLTVKDYNRFTEIGKKLTDETEIYIYSREQEAFELRLPEIAAKEGNYLFARENG
tara:strand:+ start:911 stop:1117 length:207 start_codon:yes stop_codon:yes gene_type:complete